MTIESLIYNSAGQNTLTKNGYLYNLEILYLLLGYCQVSKERRGGGSGSNGSVGLKGPQGQKGPQREMVN